MNEDGQTRLHLVCQDICCSVEEVRDLLSTFPEALERRDVYGRTVGQAFAKRVTSFFPLFAHTQRTLSFLLFLIR